jgi:hypothetical protein
METAPHSLPKGFEPYPAENDVLPAALAVGCGRGADLQQPRPPSNVTSTPTIAIRFTRIRGFLREPCSTQLPNPQFEHASLDSARGNRRQDAPMAGGSEAVERRYLVVYNRGESVEDSAACSPARRAVIRRPSRSGTPDVRSTGRRQQSDGTNQGLPCVRRRRQTSG